ncbi:uncharacterized protein T551_02725 [Pneumocystis jirovecii RU7]|uniref:Uncharacterized protein n=1 Tax=Pneumocystis jirovecii (strain RU7) TaxID=1408657 RepID=A0A0W4ZIW3_PNEJ7|nr:uncharacterized protein T551_02725 [Pneumocystis jirovecii RU7]KTW28306.1 hypothetical protein T551_02725 [Pneumocystis jirovecii RU7]
MANGDKKLAFKVARALYDFNGQKEYNELSLTAGEYVIVDDIEVDDIWAFAALKRDPTQKGLVPQEYLIYLMDSSSEIFDSGSESIDIVNFMETASKFIATESFQENVIDKDSSNAFTLGNRSESEYLYQSYSDFKTYIPLQPCFVRKTLNRLLTFATTGTEDFFISNSLGSLDYIKNPQKKYITEADIHYIEDGPKWKSKVGIFDVFVHDPQKKIFPSYLKSHVTYKVTSCFPTNKNSLGIIKVTVERRYSQFQWFHNKLLKKYSLLVWPKFPEKQITHRFNDEFLERRRSSLERYIKRVVKHPVARYSDLLATFLTCEDSLEFAEKMKEHDNDLIVGQKFFENVYHPDFNVDEGDAPILYAFSCYINSLDRHVPSIINSFRNLRYSIHTGADKLKLFGQNILKLVSKHNFSGTNSSDSSSRNIWCHKDECSKCEKLTNILKITSDALISCSNICKLWAIKHSEKITAQLNEWKQPAKDTTFLYKIYLATLKKYLYADKIDPMHDNESFEELRQRYDTIFNIIMAEIDRIHEEKIDSFKVIAMELLDQEILLQKKKLEILENARSGFEYE